MPSTTWTAGNGSFFTAGNWNNGVPGVGYDGTIDGSITTPLAITYAGSDTLNTLSMAFATLSMTSGTLTIAAASGLSGFTEAAGLIDFKDGALNTAVSSFSGVVTQTAGTIQTDAGTLSLTGGGSFAGTLSGAGIVQLGGGTTYTLKHGVDLLDGGLIVAGTGTELALATGAVQVGFTLQSGTTLSVGAYALNLGGTSALNGLVIGSTRVLVTGHVNDSFLTLGGSTSLLADAMTTQAGQVNLGNGSGATAIDNETGAVYDIVNQSSSAVFGGDGSGQFDNGGLFELTGTPAFTYTVNALFVNSYAGTNGTISVANGGLYFNISSAYAGTITGSGNGLVQLGGGGQQTLDSGLVVSVPTLEIRDSGTTLDVLGALSISKTLNEDASTSIALGANALTLVAGSTVNAAGFIGGSGTVSAKGLLNLNNGFQLGGGETLINTGSINQTYQITLGNNGGSVSLQNSAGAVYDIVFQQGDELTILNGGGDSFTNAGLFEDTAGTGTDLIDPVFTSTGTVQVTSGNLYFINADTFGGSITGTGNGTVLLGGGAAQTLSSGVVVSVPTLDIVDSGTSVSVIGPLSITKTLNQNAATSVSLGANALTLTASSTVSTAGFIGGSGTVSAAGLLYLNGSFQLGGSETLINTGSINQTYQITLGNSNGNVLLKNQAGAIYNIVFSQGDELTILNGGGGSFTNAGLFEDTAGTGTDRIDPVFTSTGTVQVVGGDLYFINADTFGGTMTGSSGGTVSLGGGVQQTLASGIVLSVPTLDVVDSGTTLLIQGPLTIANTLNQNGSTTISLGANTLTLGSGSKVATSGLITGSGTVLAEGSLSLNGGFDLGGTETLINSGSITQSYQIQLGNGGGATLLQNNAGGIYDITFDQGDELGITNDGNGAIVNAGLFEKTGGIGTGVFRIDPTFTDFSGSTAGTVEVTIGTLYFHGASIIKGLVGGAGSVWFGGSTTQTLNAGTTLSTTGVSIVDSGTNLLLNTSLTYSGAFNENGATSLTLAGTTLTLASTATANINGFVGGTGKLLNQGLVDDVGMNLGNTATLENSGTIVQTYQLALGNGTGATLLQNDAGKIYDITFDQGDQLGITSDGNAVISNSGLFEKTAGVGVSRIDAKFNQTSTGTISVDASGTLYFTGGGSIAGKLTGTGGTVLLGGGNTWTLTGPPSVSVSTLGVVDSGTTVALSSNLTYAGTLSEGAGATLQLSTHTLTLTGVANLGGLVTGSTGATLLLNAGSTANTNGDTIGGAATLQIKGTAAQSANNTLGDTATSTAALSIVAGSTYNFTQNAEMFRNGTTTVTNAGTLEKTGGTGTSQIDPLVTNSGTVIASEGTLAFSNTVTNNAGMSASLGAELLFSGALTDTSGDKGTITVSQGGTASFGGYVDAGQTLDFADNTGFAIVTSQNVFHGTIAGFVLGDTMDVTGLAQPTSNGYNTTTDTLTMSNTGGQSVSLIFAGSYTLGNFSIISDGHGGTYITDPPAAHAAAYVPGHAFG